MIALVEDQPAEGDRDDRVHVRVGGDLRDRRVLEQPGVAGEGQQRAEGDQVDQAEDRAAGPLGEVDVAAPRRRPGRTRRRRGRPAGTARRWRRAGRAAARCAGRRTSRSPTSPRRRRRPAGRRSSLRPTGCRSSDEPAEADQHGAERAPGDPLAGARRSRITHSGIEAISSAARPEGTVCSATETTALAPGSISPTKPAERSSARVGRQHRGAFAQREDRQQDQPDRDEARARAQERRDRLDHQGDARGTSSPRRCRRSTAPSRPSKEVRPPPGRC